MKTSQRDFVIKQLNLNGYISRNLCLQESITRLGAIVCDLKEEGWEFEGKYVKENGGKNFYYYVKTTPMKKSVYYIKEIDKLVTTYK